MGGAGPRGPRLPCAIRADGSTAASTWSPAGRALVAARRPETAVRSGHRSNGEVPDRVSLDRSFAWNAAHPPKLPPRPRKLRATRACDCSIAVSRAPRDGRGSFAEFALDRGVCPARLRCCLTYKTVRTGPRRLRASEPRVLPARRPAVADPPRARWIPRAVTWAVSLGLPSPIPPSGARRDARQGEDPPDQILIVRSWGRRSRRATPSSSPMTTRSPRDGRRTRGPTCRGASLLSNTAGEHVQMVFENPALSALVVDRVRRAVGQRPMSRRSAPPAARERSTSWRAGSRPASTASSSSTAWSGAS